MTTIEQVHQVCRHLGPPLYWRRALRLLNRRPEVGMTTLDAGEVLVVLIADLLFQAPLSDQEQVWLIVESFRQSLHDYGCRLYGSLEENKATLPVAYLVVADRRYATLTGRSGILDLQSGDELEHTPVRALETVAYDLAALFLKYRDSLATSQEGPVDHAVQTNRQRILGK